MPLYEYVCRDCQQEQEILVRGAETPVCAHCGSRQLAKLLSVPAAPAVGGAAPAEAPRTGPCGSACGCFPPSSMN
jgi:putative FmdB family regulatory protein